MKFSLKPASFFTAALTAMAFMALCAPSAHAAPDPVEKIRKQDVELQKLLRDKNVSKQTDRVKALINGIFDFEELGRRALGTANWNKMTPAQRTRFVKAFKAMVENSSVKRLEAYSSDSTRYSPAAVNGDRATVSARVYSKGSVSVVEYKLLLKQNEWRAWDLVIDDLSTAGNYGDQFRKILQKNTLDALIARIEARAKEDAGAQAQTVTDDVKSKSGKSGATRPPSDL
ncbi:MAG TPA: ABC transporter substrate-binding protein [Fibrobacteria bacterium]|jgi:phospholipid transport system substrate-binding protein|nr:ABC transporter substrate-binding protein [Fibrobacteria bacterium]